MDSSIKCVIVLHVGWLLTNDTMHIQIDHISKTFGTLRANDDITLSLHGGHIYAILGENGAGKSTLMKILSGYQPADSGRLLLDDQPVRFHTPADALIRGIGMLHQEPLDVPPLTVLENFILGRPTAPVPDRRKARAALHDTAGRLGFTVRPDAYIDTLTIGERQQLEITRLVSLGARFLILDEPTTGISAAQKETLFTALRTLAVQEDMTVALVSHKLEDVEALCDHVFVLRTGRVVGDAPMPLSATQMVEMMFGKRVDPEPRPKTNHDPRISLQIESLHVHDQRLTVQDVSLTAHAGQVIGLAGLDGSGQRAFLRACVGLERVLSGKIILKQRDDITNLLYHERTARGVVFAPAGRLEEGLISGLTLTEHFELARGHSLRVNPVRAAREAMRGIEQYRIRGMADSPIQTLSGGNQQRVLLALLQETPVILLLENPTRGLDVDSARWIWEKLLEKRATGTTILFVSPDLDEIIQYSESILVFFGGRATFIGDPSRVTAGELGQLIGGGRG